MYARGAMQSAHLACVENKLGASCQALCHDHQVLERRTVVDNVLIVIGHNGLLQRASEGRT